MKRKKRGERVEKLRGWDTDDFRTLREKAQRWADNNVEKLKDARPTLPDGLNDRAADNWEPLLAIAELAGGDWPMRALAAAIRLSGDWEAAAESAGTQLLRAIKVVFETLGVDRITSEELADELAKDKDSPWAAYGKTGKPITQRQIAALLDRYGVRPDSIRVSGISTKKGYLFAWLEDAFETYLDAVANAAPSDPEHRNKRTATGTSNTFSPGIGNDAFRSENGENVNSHGPCSGVPDRNSDLHEEHENNPSAPRFQRPSPRTVSHNTGDPIATVRANPLKPNGRSSADGADANHPRETDPGKMVGWRGRI
jgi:putative DNA primase/helicase